MPQIFDNIELELLPTLRAYLERAVRFDASIGYFNLRGWGTLADLVDCLPPTGTDAAPARILIGMQGRPEEDVRQVLRERRDGRRGPDQQSTVKRAQEAATEFRRQLEFGVPEREHETALQELRRQLLQRQVQVRIFLENRLHAKLYLFHQNDLVPRTGFVGSSNLTLSGLSGNGELNVDVLDHDATEKLALWFDERWNADFCVDISDELAKIIDESWASEKVLSPYLVYLKMAYHLSQEARAGLSEFHVPVAFLKDLLEFQSAALRIAARHLHQRGGVLIGDVVGLGKTLVGSALAKLFEEDFDYETLILCPKNLVGMWEDYRVRYALNATVHPLSRTKELSDFGRYRMVLIDESHNLRNRESVAYEHVKEYIERNDSKCIMLTATPYNKEFLDLGSQLRLFLNEDADLGVRPERLAREMGEDEFLYRTEGRTHSIGAFEKSPYADDWRDLMRHYLVRRTRGFIRDNYAQTDEEGRRYLLFSDGRRSHFPERVPRAVPHTLRGDNDPYAMLFSSEVLDTIDALKLPRYGLVGYLDEKAELTNAEQDVKRNLTRAGQRLIGLTRTGLFKRLESSGSSFIKSVERHVLRNHIFLHALDNGLAVPVGQAPRGLLDDDEDGGMDRLDVDQEVDTGAVSFSSDGFAALAEVAYGKIALSQPGGITWVRPEVFTSRLREELTGDSDALIGLLRRFGRWDPSADSKADALVSIIRDRHPQEKVLVFTEYADTAHYLGNVLTEQYGIEAIGVVTGSDRHPEERAWRFSPLSNGKRDRVAFEDELRVLIATDVLSEGQNLQDAAIVVTYDLPWAIIKLVQRAGRVDRLGQDADTIYLYTIEPPEGVESILNLRRRVKRRLRDAADVVGMDERFFDDEADRRVIEGLYDERSEVLEDDDYAEVDIASYAYQIWKGAVETDPSLEQRVGDLPDVVNATRSIVSEPWNAEGVLVYTRTKHGSDTLSWVDLDGNEVTQSPLEVLRAAASGPETLGLPRQPEHHELVQEALRQVREGISGQAVGALSGPRATVYARLERYERETRNSLLEVERLRDTLAAIYEQPLQEKARETLVRQMRLRVDDRELALRAVQLHTDDRLCREQPDLQDEEVHIVCSMGLVRNAPKTQAPEGGSD